MDAAARLTVRQRRLKHLRGALVSVSTRRHDLTLSGIAASRMVDHLLQHAERGLDG